MNPCAVAIVVDPKRTMSAGQVEIGAYRTYENDEIADELKKRRN